MSRIRQLIALLAVALLLSSCQSATTDPGPSASGSSGSDGAFPVTIEHAHGTTTIPAEPTRVVTIGWITDDVVAGLGVVPVGSPTQWGADPDGYLPWFKDRVAELGGDLPELLNSKDGTPDFEQILALDPDLILAPHSGITDEECERLSQIAPTVAYQEKPWMSGDWRELVELVGRALGRTDEAAAQIAETEAKLDQVRTDHPEFVGTSFLYGTGLSEGSNDVTLYVSNDPRVRFLRELGFVDSPSLDQLQTENEDAFYGAVSLENLNSLSTELFIGWSNDAATSDRTVNNPLFSRWQPIFDGHYYLIADATLAMATNGPSPLSIDWALQSGFVEELAQAVDGQGVVRDGRDT